MAKCIQHFKNKGYCFEEKHIFFTHNLVTRFTPYFTHCASIIMSFIVIFNKGDSFILYVFMLITLNKVSHATLYNILMEQNLN